MLFDRLTGPAHDWVKLLSVCGTFFAKIKIVSRETRILSLQHNINGVAGFCYFKDYRKKRIFWKVDEFRGRFSNIELLKRGDRILEKHEDIGGCFRHLDKMISAKNLSELMIRI